MLSVTWSEIDADTYRIQQEFLDHLRVHTDITPEVTMKVVDGVLQVTEVKMSWGEFLHLSTTDLFPGQRDG